MFLLNQRIYKCQSKIEKNLQYRMFLLNMKQNYLRFARNEIYNTECSY